MVLSQKSKHKLKKKKSKNIVSFDQEVVTKDSAEKILLTQPVVSDNVSDNNNADLGDVAFDDTVYNESKQKGNMKSPKNSNRRGQKRKKVPEPSEIEELDTNMGNDDKKPPKKVKKKKQVVDNVEPKPELEQEGDVNLEKSSIKQEESIRAQKRKKHAKLLEEKRLKTLLSNQQSALSYLSLWKHNRNEWKFEKLKQIWLQQNLLDPSRIPNEFWDAAIEYFCGSKGSIRKTILKSALDVIEKEEKSEEKSTEDNYVLILQRARDIVQNLQE